MIIDAEECILMPGKLPFDLLSQLLEKVVIHDTRVALGPTPGEDAALIDCGDRYLVAKTDPVTFATDLIGWYVVHVNANDIASVGATPKWLMVTLLLPEGIGTAEVRRIFDQILEACSSLNIALVGGHTEITQGISRPVAVGAMLGEVPKDQAVLTSGARPGDAIVLTKNVPIEGTAILAREAPGELVKAGALHKEIERASQLIFEPGISVVKDASIACRVARVHAMHDPTEGGLATALLELATAAEVGLTVNSEDIPFVSELHGLWDGLGLDPLGLIASGALLITLDPAEVPQLIHALELEGIPASVIGCVTPAEHGLKLKTCEGTRDLPFFERDELAKFFAGRGAVRAKLRNPHWDPITTRRCYD